VVRFHSRDPKFSCLTALEIARINFCPKSGSFLRISDSSVTLGLVGVDHNLVEHVSASTGLPPSQAARVVEDVIAYLAEPLESFVRRRHTELQTRGAKNPEIFTRIAAELQARVVAPPELSERQLRRIVYG
jgi:hypothetical protein